jgi:hypothetical protein
LKKFLISVRKEVFDKSNDPAVAPAVILFYNYANNRTTDQNIINHIALKPNRFFSLFKIFILQRTDYKQITQAHLIENDWLWKVLLYGSYLDFNLIKRLNSDFETIHKVIERKKYLVGTGIQYGQDKRDSQHLIGLPFLDVKYVKPFFIIPHPKKTFTKSYIHRPRDKKLFEGYRLIVKKGLNQHFKSTAAIIDKKAIFKDSLTAIRAFEDSDIQDLKIFCGLLHSKMFSYFILQTGTSTGVEREQGFNEEKFNFPFINNSTISKYVSEIESISEELIDKRYSLLNSETLSIEAKKRKLIEELDDEILKSYNLNEQEKALIDYADKMTIPYIMKHKGYEENALGYLRRNDPFLISYIDVFFNRFGKAFEKNDKKFVVKILHNDYIVGMFFGVIDAKHFKDRIVWKHESKKGLLSKLHSLGCQEITRNLFLQKDIRGFEKDGFYIVKPNEKRLWHKAVAYLDVAEFADAMLKKD